MYLAVTILTRLKKQIGYKQAVACSLSFFREHSKFSPSDMDEVSQSAHFKDVQYIKQGVYSSPVQIHTDVSHLEVQTLAMLWDAADAL